ncbi:MAG: ribbon-helix-helix domain-containing protein [Hyphomicrobiaceae bacterium]
MARKSKKETESRPRKERAAPTSASAPARRKEAMLAASGKTRARRTPQPEPPPTPIGKGRQGLKPVAIYMNPVAKEVLIRISEATDKTIQELGLEALNLLFERYDEKPVA